ncbi:MAG TPA: twin-arginine translocation signal domain-containing protein, partial [Verrucomicrobiae bacterium]
MIDDLNPLTRRDFIKLIGASAALAGLPACTRQSVDKIVPYVTDPEQLAPGKPLYFATATAVGGFATGLLVESHEGHPTKIEGNPDHPASLGATNIFHQAALLDLYDPDRSQAVLHQGQPSTWEDFVSALQQVLDSQSAKHGRGLALLTETITSPTLQFQMQRLQQRFPEAKWHRWEPLNRDNVREGAKLAFGEIVETHFHFDKARIIVALESDFLFSHPNSVRYARDFATLRRARLPEAEMSRLYAVESSPSLTGANADHRLPLRSSDIPAFAHELAGQLGLIPQAAARAPHSSFISALVEDLSRHRGESIVAVGDSQPPSVHALAHALNHFLGNVGNTITFTRSAEADPANQAASLGELTDALRGGQVEALVILGGNPAFNAPANYEFAKHLAAAKFTAHLSPDLNETTMLCGWHVPQNHFLESWSDARAFDGTVSIIQPLILPLYAGKTAHEVLDAMLSPPGRSDYQIVRDFWSQQNAGDDFEHRWRRALHDGLIAGTALPQKSVLVRPPES